MRRLFCAVVVALVTISASFGADAGLLALLPADAKIAGGMYVSRTASTPFGQFLLSQMKEADPTFTKFVTATGFDPRIHLQEVVFASTTAIGRKEQGFVAARGNFNGPQIIAAAKAEGATTSSYKGIELVQGKGERGAIAILDATVAIIGDLPNVRRAIDQRSAPVALDPKLLTKVNDVSSRFDAWMVSLAPVSSLAGAAPNAQANNAMKSNAMQGIEQTSGGIRFGTIVEFAGEALTKSEKDAQALADVVRFAVGMMQMHQEKNPEAAKFAKLVETLEVKTLASTVQLTLSIPQAAIEELVKSRKAAVRRASLN